MRRGIKTLVLGFILALCAFSINTPVALAETVTDPNVSVESTEPVQPEAPVTPEVTETTETDQVTEVNEPSIVDSTETDPNLNPEDPEVTEDPETELPPVTDENGEEVEPGTLPDSPFYWLTTLIEKLQVIFTVDPVAKTELLEDQALERMAEAQALIEEGNTEDAEVALQAYSAKVTEAQAFVATLTETDSETREKLETALSNSHAKNIQTLGGLLDKLPPQAAEKVALNVVRSMEKSIAKMEKKEQLKVAKELRKATKGLEDSEIAEEDQEALENLEEIIELDNENLEDNVAADSGAQLSSMALTTGVSEIGTLQVNSSKVSEESRQALVPKEKGKEAASEVKVKKEETTQQLELKEQENKKQQELKEQEKKQPDQQEEIKPEQDKVEKNQSTDNPAEKQQVEKQKVEKQDKSENGKSKNKE